METRAGESLVGGGNSRGSKRGAGGGGGGGGSGSEGRREKRCGGGCCSRLTTLLCSNLGICLLVLLYTLAGAFIFASIEGGSTAGPEVPAVATPSMQHVTEEGVLDATSGPGKAEAVIDSHQTLLKMRQETVDRLWTITESLNILYRKNWTRVAEEELERFSEHLLSRVRQQEQTAASRDAKASQPHRWSFAGSFLYSLTVITTIGYGSVAPHTGLGKVVTILYALLGIPLMLLYLSSVGDLLSRLLKWIWVKVCRCGRKRRNKGASESLVRANHIPGSYSNLDPKKLGKWGDISDEYLEDKAGAIPVTLCLLVMVAYMCGGAAVFSYTHNWPFLHAIFFCFSSLTTIGFGDLSPGVGTRSEASLQISLLGAAIYLLIGMALIATCFNLMQEQVTTRGGGLSRKLGGMIGSSARQHRFHLEDT